MTTDKVYCGKCKHYSIPDFCNCEGNRKYGDTYEQRYFTCIRKPEQINKFNDCRWYEEKT